MNVLVLTSLEITKGWYISTYIDLKTDFTCITFCATIPILIYYHTSGVHFQILEVRVYYAMLLLKMKKRYTIKIKVILSSKLLKLENII